MSPTFQVAISLELDSRPIWILEQTQVKTYMDTMGVWNTSSEYLSSALWAYQNKEWNILENCQN